MKGQPWISNKMLESLDELLFEIMSWVIFFPITLWRVLRRPLPMMEYADDELEERASDQYADTLSPPVFLLVCLLVSHAIEVASSGSVNPVIANDRGLASYVDSDAKLLIVRLAFFSFLPLALAMALLIGRQERVTRDLLRPPFYAQCYPAGAFALFLGVSLVLAGHQTSPGGAVIGALMSPLCAGCLCGDPVDLAAASSGARLARERRLCCGRAPGRINDGHSIRFAFCMTGDQGFSPTQ